MITVQLSELEAEKVRACILYFAKEAENDVYLLTREIKKAESMGEDVEEHLRAKSQFYADLANKFKTIK